MKMLLLPGAVLLFFSMTTLWGSSLSASQDRDINVGMRKRFIGA